MNEAGRRFKIGLLALGVFHLIYFCAVKFGETLGISGVLYPNGTPVGGDFINLWSVGKLILADRIGDIYDVDRFMAYQGSFTGSADIGLRLWAYPAQSLLLAWPFGLFGYYAALAIWSLAGLAVLAMGARRFGFDGMEIAIILMSPATVLNLYYGQTGSVAAGLMLLALSPRSARDPISIAAAALLTIKPQAGFLLPVLWAFQRRWQLIAITALAVIGLVALSIAVFGLEPWRGYLGDTVPVLSALESEGTGPFMAMIPSLFMALRIVTGNSGLAMLIHVAFAAIVLVVLLARLWRIEDENRCAAMVLIATVLMTPYMHNYDLALLLCGALLVARRWSPMEKGLVSADLLVLLAWALPHVVVTLNRAGAPISPLLILPLLLAA